MKKRQFFGALAAAGALPVLDSAHAAPVKTSGPVLLTVTGPISKPNRGPLDPGGFDQMLVKHKVSFTKAYVFDFAMLAALPAITIKPTLEYDNKPHTLKGPLLVDVLKAAGATLTENSNIVLRAVDGYAATVTVAQARAQRYIIATHLEGAPIALGGLGPLWAVYDADKVPDMAKKPVAERFGSCPWGLYHVEVQSLVV
ncbi:molybdopterin-dependent oxidoreductase [Duganella sp. FT92W]|uniref:Molybdopterin-dependent oxidoreductase n=1 Tax=Pseudoduganella rivuli TaxID=2666085 RepID=A0A7X2LS93_9BURK|nr:molybdopterin-dependent oxidoreductase [Pseudoduganella rivuli]MRV70712.1 molybdopterin-dependent oxidoreductase [Pseudoduganella rivuli]